MIARFDECAGFEARLEDSRSKLLLEAVSGREDLRFEESYGVALAARPVKTVAISSAKPGEFREMTKEAKPIPWPYPLLSSSTAR